MFRDSYACERLTHPYICIMYISHIRRLWLCYSIRIGQVIKLQNDIMFFQRPCTSEFISMFLKYSPAEMVNLVGELRCALDEDGQRQLWHRFPHMCLVFSGYTLKERKKKDFNEK